ncbi:glutathione S-transferase family protein [Pseudobacteriovorax antillogorgiicola]|uniref:Glutathione S-transferase n=1 Tax=Pseudobacteriovorax antillogorgiicola TaxID=1513793 RepID=A0A1Y6CNT7_9BACT|nr:glutathione S-transferase family protein [Pseudobacteriovorax antillogorgiicola]TCS46981.1 glutathione S-transferase [Pseudobacteriovorax antillogorgiicola]SMF64727.1 glutathione S-transferase [Pseudobacteriovorax antillogorgiicola]
MIQIYGAKISRAIRCLWAAEELNLEVEFIPVEMSLKGLRSPEFLALNPNGKVPVLKDDSFVLWESGAICSYLARLQPEQDLLPRDSKKQGLCEQWMQFAIAEVDAHLWAHRRHTFIYPEEKRIAEVVPSLHYEFKRSMGVLDQGLSNKDYLLGDFTLADIMIGQTLFWAVESQFPLVHDSIEQYVRRLRGRSGFRRVIEKYVKS